MTAPVGQTASVKNKAGSSFPRFLMLVAILLGICSLGMRSPKASGSISYAGPTYEWSSPGHSYEVNTQNSEKYYPMGYEIGKPHAFYVFAGLLLVYLTGLCKKPFWLAYGYWITFGLVLIFTPPEILIVPAVVCVTSFIAALMNTGASNPTKAPAV